MNLAGEICIFLGTLFFLVSAIGIHRFDDVYQRMHAMSKATSAGFLLIALGTVLAESGATSRSEVILAGILILFTVPVSGHLLARAAYLSGPDLSNQTIVDELAEADRAEGEMEQNAGD